MGLLTEIYFYRAYCKTQHHPPIFALTFRWSVINRDYPRRPPLWLRSHFSFCQLQHSYFFPSSSSNRRNYFVFRLMSFKWHASLACLISLLIFIRYNINIRKHVEKISRQPTSWQNWKNLHFPYLPKTSNLDLSSSACELASSQDDFHRVRREDVQAT